ncbi:MAG: ABC transporter ATP-binding protein [Anaerolineaceae bacterium]|nr:ABC transporter ATP-binding protein [Anaerolineaceae bacterium]MDE0328900.1 ABC transporter ATP-binding protein [Anaerolineaceae bacterium]
MSRNTGEFSVADAYRYNHAGVRRWIFSHILRYRLLFLRSVLLFLIGWSAMAWVRVLIGDAAREISNPSGQDGLMLAALAVLVVSLIDSLAHLGGSLSIETMAQKLAHDSREELYVSLLGKSQTFHDRQRVGDVMARATDDVNQLDYMVHPGIFFIIEIVLGLVLPVVYIAFINPQLILVPVLFILVYIVTVRSYFRRLSPVIGAQRFAFGIMNAGLEETITGIEVVKGSARESFERRKFMRNAKAVRDYLVEQGTIEARYLPYLFYGFALGLSFLHTMILFGEGRLDIGGVVAVTGLVSAMRFPVFISVFAFTLVQLGIAGGERILELIRASADMDENVDGHSGQVQGDLVFENVSFGYDDGMVLQDISFHVRPGETVAIVGQTGSGKSTLTDLINRTYDVTSGRILIDGVDIRDWQLDSVRSQISRIEQDVFLFSRSIAENIAFGMPDASHERIVEVAREAQAHDFVESFAEGYETEIGERGVMLSGGQRQRLALARAFLSDPRILILDDSTSAIDSATEDEIQHAINRARQGRTTLLITHRLSQIRWADHILVLDEGRLAASGSHEELLRDSELYRRIFARYDVALPAV